MNDQVLSILKGCLIALLYLFLFRVIWVVNRELQGTQVTVPRTAPPRPAPQPAPDRKRKHWQLEVLQPATARGTRFAVDQEVTIGRGAGCAISIEHDTYASTVHARVFPRGDDLFIEDLASTNGTTLNGRRISEETRVRKGDRIGVGGTVLEVHR